jgi:hypothetical protein
MLIAAMIDEILDDHGFRGGAAIGRNQTVPLSRCTTGAQQVTCDGERRSRLRNRASGDAAMSSGVFWPLKPGENPGMRWAGDRELFKQTWGKSEVSIHRKKPTIVAAGFTFIRNAKCPANATVTAAENACRVTLLQLA